MLRFIFSFWQLLPQLNGISLVFMKLDVKHYDERGVFVKKLLYCLKYLHYLTFFNSVYHFQHVSVCFGLAVTSSAHSIFSFIFSL